MDIILEGIFEILLVIVALSGCPFSLLDKIGIFLIVCIIVAYVKYRQHCRNKEISNLINHLPSPKALGVEPYSSAPNINISNRDKRIHQIITTLDGIDWKADNVCKIIGLTHELLALGENDLAKIKYERILSLDPHNHVAYNNLGVALKRLGQMEEAIVKWQAAIRIKQDYIPAYFNMAPAYITMGLTDEAEKALKLVIESEPRNHAALGNLGIVYMLKGLHDLAIKKFEEVLALNPSDAKAHYYVGVCSQRGKEYNKALSECKQAIKINEEFEPAYVLMGDTYILKGDVGRGNQIYRDALKINPDFKMVKARLEMIAARPLSAHKNQTPITTKTDITEKAKKKIRNDSTYDDEKQKLLDKLWKRLNPNVRKCLIILVWAFGGISSIIIITNAWFTLTERFQPKPPAVNRSEIISLTKQSKWYWNKEGNSGGNYSAFRDLQNIKTQLERIDNDPKLVNFVKGQIDEVKSHYANINEILFFPPILGGVESGSFYYDLQLKTNIIISYAFNENQKWYTRAKATFLLRYRKEKSVPGKLIELLDNPTALLVKVAALSSYCEIAGFEKDNPLDFNRAKKDWKSRKNTIIRKLIEDGKAQIRGGPPLSIAELNIKFPNYGKIDYGPK